MEALINRAPFACIAIFFIAGIALANVFTWLSDLSREIVVYVLAGTVAALLAGMLFFFYRSARRYLYFSTLILTGIILALALSTGMLHKFTRDDFPDHHVASFPGIEEEVIFLGETRMHGSSAGGRQRFILEARRLYTDGRIIHATGRMLVTIDTTLALPPPGHVVLVKGRFLTPPGRCNPGEFAYDVYLKRLGILRVMNANQLHLLKPARGAAPLVRRQIYRFQQKIKAAIDQFIDSNESRAILNALILGDQSTLDPITRSAFQQTGLSHVLAVSGLHVMLVGLVVYQLLGPIFLRFGCSWHHTNLSRTTITLLILCAYMLISGARASVCRAVLVSMLMIGGTLFQRPSSSINALGVAAFVLLIYRPAYLFDLGFQLSFLAVLSILLLMPVFTSTFLSNRDIPLFAKGILQSTFVSIAATLGTMPVLLYHFGYLSFAGILLNIPALPLVALCLMSGLLTLVAAAFAPGLASLFGSTADFLIHTLLTIVDAGANHLSLFSISPGTVSLQTVGLIFLFCLMILALSRPRFRWRLWLISACCVTLGLWINIVSVRYQPKLSFLFFDVGHGDATLITFPSGRRLLVDTGNTNQFVDRAQRTLLPYFQRNGINRLEGVLITHPHRDHAGGLPTLLASLPVNRVVHGFADGRLIEEMYSPPTSYSNQKFTPVSAGDTLLFDSHVSVRVLSPIAMLPDADNPNDRSVVLQILYGHTSFLMMGDAESDAEHQLLLNYPDLEATNVIKVGHHGSSTSSTRLLVDQLTSGTTHAPIAVVSTGPAKTYGLPDEEIIARWKSAGAGVHITATEGGLEVTSDGSAVWKTWSGEGCKG